MNRICRVATCASILRVRVKSVLLAVMVVVAAMAVDVEAAAEAAADMAAATATNLDSNLVLLARPDFSGRVFYCRGASTHTLRSLSNPSSRR